MLPMHLRWLPALAPWLLACGAPEPPRPPPNASHVAAAPPEPTATASSDAPTTASVDAGAPPAIPIATADAGATDDDAGASVPDEATPNPPTTAGCPASLEAAKGGPCALSTRCTYGATLCICDGYHGGIPPRPGVDYSHWSCGRTKKRSDGCPDNLRHGLACATEGKRCVAQEGVFCGPTFECRAKKWIASVNSCSTLPRAPPRH
jgi:hypothetical protein